MRYRSRTRALAALLLVAVAGIATALVLALRGEGAPPVLVDERHGVLHGVRFGDSEGGVQARLGGETDDRGGVFPEGAKYTGPISIPSPDRAPPSELHDHDTSYLVSGTVGVFSMSTLEHGARTRAGVGVGDELVRLRYDRTECGEAVAGEPLFGGDPRTYPWCRAIAGGTRVFFGGDPIESITLTRYKP
jgi:hypothetical protein